MNRIKLILFSISVAIGLSLISCGKDEPTLPNDDNEWNNGHGGNSGNDNPGDDPNPPSNIEGSEILGTWYYLSPDEAIRIVIRFTSETQLLGRKCYISVDSKFPSFTTDYANTWRYEDGKWKITRLDIANGILKSVIIKNVFDDEMWAEMDYGFSKKLIFKRKDMGQSYSPTGKTVAPDGFFGSYEWRGYVHGFNISFKFVKSNNTYYIEEVSDIPIYVDDYNKSVTTSRPEAKYADGYLSLDWSKSMITAVTGSAYLVAVKKSSTEVELYDPFNPYTVYTFKR